MGLWGVADGVCGDGETWGCGEVLGLWVDHPFAPQTLVFLVASLGSRFVSLVVFRWFVYCNSLPAIFHIQFRWKYRLVQFS